MNAVETKSLHCMALLKLIDSGSGCGSVVKAVASDTRGLQFESSHQQKFINIEHFLLSAVYWKDENKEKEAGNGPFLYIKKLIV